MVYWWLINSSPEEAHARYQQLLDLSGSVDSQKPAKKLNPRCIVCKRFMGKTSNLQIVISDEWRLHIRCFAKKIDELISQGKLGEIQIDE